MKLNSISLLRSLQAQSFANLTATGVPACAAIERDVTALQSGSYIDEPRFSQTPILDSGYLFRSLGKLTPKNKDRPEMRNLPGDPFRKVRKETNSRTVVFCFLQAVDYQDGGQDTGDRRQGCREYPAEIPLFLYFSRDDNYIAQIHATASRATA